MMFRYEKKYLINKIQIELLKNRLSSIMNLDSNVKNKDGSYLIRSLYFDDYKDTSYFLVLNGISQREKYRIRYYDYDTSYITLEKKSKVNNLGKKDKDLLDKDMVMKFIKKEEIETDKKVVNELQTKIKTNFYKPVIIISNSIFFSFTYSI